MSIRKLTAALAAAGVFALGAAGGAATFAIATGGGDGTSAGHQGQVNADYFEKFNCEAEAGEWDNGECTTQEEWCAEARELCLPPGTLDPYLKP